MERRNFFKILSTASAGAVATSCGTSTDALIPLLVPEQDLIPGVEYWHPSVCTACPSGCGVLARVMDGERIIERISVERSTAGKTEKLRQRLAAIKKLEGNPLDHVSGGRLCARGQASVQSLYNPDRLRGPMKRSGVRGEATFQPISWKEAIAEASDQLLKIKAEAADRIAIVTGPGANTRTLALRGFAKAIGAPEPVVCSVASWAAERKAAELALNWQGLPFYDVTNARHILSVGADFLGGWISPVHYARQFGAFRQARTEIRGYLAHAESRLSITASAADQWLPLKPGSEAQFLAAVGRILLDLNLAPKASSVPAGVLAAFRSFDLAALIAATGIDERRLRQAVEQLGRSEGPLVLAGASSIHTNSVDAIIASHYVNMMLGNIGAPGGILPPAKAAIEPLTNPRFAEALSQARAIILDEANPLYTAPKSAHIKEALTKAGFVLSFATTLDDSAAWADLILPAHHSLEGELAVAPSTASRVSLAVGGAFVQPLYETQAVPATLAALAAGMNVTFQPATAKEIAEPLLPKDLPWETVVREGGFHADPGLPSVPAPKSKPAAKAVSSPATFSVNPAKFEGDGPFLLQPYLSPQLHDGSLSNLPWLQECPDPASSAVWSLPVEIDPVTAQKLGIASGDNVKLESATGSITVPAYIHPGAVPGVLSMALGGGHQHFGRYASGRGANPLEILALAHEPATGDLATGATRVRLTRIGPGKDLIQYSAEDKEERPHAHR